MMKREIYQSEGYEFMGAAFEVYHDRGYGMAEEIYQESLEIELELRGIVFQSKHELRCHYKGRELKKRYVPDLFVSGCLVVELKAVTNLTSDHEAPAPQLHANHPAAGRLSGKLRAPGHLGMEAHDPFRIRSPISVHQRR